MNVGHQTGLERCATCGHPRAAHGPQEYPRNDKGCRATVYEEWPQVNFGSTAPVPRTWSSWPCGCREFKEVKRD